jgi:hypothetical protein
MKALLWLNGGGAIALLTFFGNRGKMLTTAGTDAIDLSLSCLGFGTIGSVVDSVRRGLLHPTPIWQ